MCRFIVYKGRSSAQRVLVADLVVTPVHSVIKQSFDCKERTVAGAVPPQLNADGFGVGWYSDQCACGLDSHDAPSRSGGVRERTHAPPSPGSDESGGDDKRDGSQRHFAAHVCPGVFTSISPAWNNDNLYRLSHKVQSPLVFAHVRAASLGSVVSEANCHPFAVGKYMFMHNGCVASFNSLRRQVLTFITNNAMAHIRGTTDSEHCFAMFLSEVERRYGMEKDLTATQLEECVLACIVNIEQWSKQAGISGSLLNFAVTDGIHVIATRFVDNDRPAASLYFTSGSEWIEDPVGSGQFHMVQRDRREHVVMIASEPLNSMSDGWLEVPRNHLLRVSGSMNVRIVPIDVAVRDAKLGSSRQPSRRGVSRQRHDTGDAVPPVAKRARRSDDMTSSSTGLSIHIGTASPSASPGVGAGAGAGTGEGAGTGTGEGAGEGAGETEDRVVPTTPVTLCTSPGGFARRAPRSGFGARLHATPLLTKPRLSEIEVAVPFVLDGADARVAGAGEQTTNPGVQ